MTPLKSGSEGNSFDISWIWDIKGAYFYSIDRVKFTFSWILSCVVSASTQGDQELSQVSINLLDPNLRENALRIFGLNEEDAKDLARVQQIYENLVFKLRENQKGLTPRYVHAYERIIGNVTSAYETLNRSE